MGRVLKAIGYSLQGNRKTKEGTSHPDRDAQELGHSNETVKEFQRRGQPVISVDTKKEVLVHDFMDKDLLGKAIRRWWTKMGSKRHPGAQELLITADGGGSNGSRHRLWKVALQDLANHLDIPIQVCHFPPGTSKWNKIEHRMFSHITQNWRGRPLVSHEVIINLIANTSTKQGLKIQAELDSGSYPTGIKVSDAELAAVNMEPADFHGEWNYRIIPSWDKK